MDLQCKIIIFYAKVTCAKEGQNQKIVVLVSLEYNSLDAIIKLLVLNYSIKIYDAKLCFWISVSFLQLFHNLHWPTA